MVVWYIAVYVLLKHYIAETNRNSKIGRKKHNTGKDKNSNCAKHLNDNFNHEF